MEIRFRPKEYLDTLNGSGVEEIPEKYLDDLFEGISAPDKKPEFKTIDYAMGPDFIWAYAVISTAINLISLGAQINGGFEGWLELAKKIRRLIKNTEDIALDKDAISVLCVSNILESASGIKEIKKVIEYETETPTFYGYGGKCDFSEFVERANTYYVQGFEVNSKQFILFGGYQSGNLELLSDVEIVKYR